MSRTQTHTHAHFIRWHTWWGKITNAKPLERSQQLKCAHSFTRNFIYFFHFASFQFEFKLCVSHKFFPGWCINCTSFFLHFFLQFREINCTSLTLFTWMWCVTRRDAHTANHQFKNDCDYNANCVMWRGIEFFFCLCKLLINKISLWCVHFENYFFCFVLLLCAFLSAHLTFAPFLFILIATSST